MTAGNRLRERIEAGEVALGGEVSTASTALIELYGHLGLDFVWSDFEHRGGSIYDTATLEHQVRAAEAGDTELLVRVPSVDPPAIRKVLDASVRSVLVPRVERAEEVRRAVRAARFSLGGEPGDRGLGKGRANRWGTDMEGYVERQDETVLVGAMIETTAAVENIEEIVAVDGLGFVFLGPWDISQSAGHPMATDHEAVEAAVDRTRRACRDAGLPYGGYFPDPEEAQDRIESGAQVVLLGDEVSAVTDTFSDRLAAMGQPSDSAE